MTFNYQKKVWGGTKIKLEKSYLAYLRLKYTLQDLEKVQGKVLDVGCGGGGFAASIHEYRDDLEVHGVDISRAAVAAAKKRYPNLKVKVGDVYKLPYRSNQFDAIVVADVFEHLEDPEGALSEISRVLKPNGVLTAYIPLEGSLFSLHKWLYLLGWRAKERLAGHIQRLTMDDIRKMLSDTNFKLKEHRYGPHLLGQIIDVLWFSILSLTGKKLDVGLEEDLDETSFFGRIKQFITVLTNVESQILLNIPAAGVHISAQKKK